MPVYRNQTPTIAQIQMMSRMRITTAQEAVAFLRAIAPLNEQVAYVLQRSSLREQQAANAADMATRKVEDTPAPAPVVTPEPEKTFVPEDLSSDEGFSDSEIEEKVAKLKKAKK